MINKATLYRIWDNRKALLIFYGAMYAVMLTSILAMSLSPLEITMGGLESASMIFIFIIGLIFAESFKMLLQNGCSRKTIFLSFVYSIIAIATLMALVDSVNGLLMKLVTDYESGFFQLYRVRYQSYGQALQVFEGLLWNVTAYVMLAMVGLFITSLYYRMNKLLKVLVSVGVPAFFIIALPIIDTLADGAIYLGMRNFFNFAWGYNHGFNPYFSMVSTTLFSIILGGLAYLLMRRAIVKE